MENLKQKHVLKGKQKGMLILDGEGRIVQCCRSHNVVEVCYVTQGNC